MASLWTDRPVGSDHDWLTPPPPPRRRPLGPQPPPEPPKRNRLRRGLIGGLVAIAQTVGIVGGVAIASLTGSIAAGYLATMVALLVLTVPYALGSRDLALPAGHRPPPFSLGPGNTREPSPTAGASCQRVRREAP